MAEASNRLGDLVETLYESTLARNVPWGEAAETGKFQARIESIIVTIERLYEDEAESFYTQVELKSLKGVLLEQFWPSMIDGAVSPKFNLPWGVLMQNLHAAARRQALGVEDAIESVLSALKKKGS